MQTNMPSSPVDKGLKLLQEFLKMESAGGLLLMAAAVLALIVANSPLNGLYRQLLNLPIQVSIGSFGIHKPLALWVDDGLMAVFFFLVGMELKREVVEGHLSSLQQASLPSIAALGGMLAPAAIYAIFNHSDPVALKGWAIPAATDIAFALGVLSLLGNRVPTPLKAFLLSVAIFDDVGAILVIAIFYTAKLSIVALAIALVLVVVAACFNLMGVKKSAPYILIGIPMWVALLKSGVHATLAGVALAMFIPLRMPENADSSAPSEEPLLRQLEHALHPWVAFGVLPVFAFVNAGVSLSGMSIKDAFGAVPLGIIAGLFVGKQIGIMGTCWAAVRLGIASLPGEVNWRQLYGAAVLCGIGFTMSLFIASLAFAQNGIDYHGLDRLGILIGSFVAGLVGYFMLSKSLGEAKSE
jgi:Na+:H+ antiporter, NhaA family